MQTSNNGKNYHESELNKDAMDWEASREFERQRSERKAWFVAFCSCAVSILLAASIIFMMPLKTTEPYVVHVNDRTGETSIISVMDVKKVELGEMVDKSWLNKYVIAHESYDWHTLQKDYDDVMLMSSPQIGKDYDALFSGEDALDKKYGDKIRITVDVGSITIHGNGIGTVRYSKTMKRPEEREEGTVTHWVATIAYEYLIDEKKLENERIKNPVGFTVTSLRNDPEMVGSKP
jgi:type IV secretion system protein VirB8